MNDGSTTGGGMPPFLWAYNVKGVTDLILEHLNPCNLIHLCYKKMLSKPKEQPKEKVREQVSNNKRARERTWRMLDCIPKLGCLSVSYK